jgi:hypothetical protein
MGDRLRKSKENSARGVGFRRVGYFWMLPLGLLLLAAMSACGGVDATWRDESKVHQKKENGDIPIPDYRVGECGTVAVTATLTDSGTSITFAFTPTTPLPEGCCEAYGWIQHVTWGGRWTFDNAAGTAAGGAGGAGHGANSDPTTAPQGSSEGDRWTPNPWYGGNGNVTDGMGDDVPDDWDEHPQPQTTIRDTPEGNDGFITQLVCVETGAIVFQYRWRQQKPRGSTQWEFVGAEGTNLTLTPR